MQANKDSNSNVSVNKAMFNIFFSSLARAQCYKTFYVRHLRSFVKSRNFCPWQDFLAESNVCGYARAYTIEASPVRCCTLGQAPFLTQNYQTRLERHARDKHCSLLEKIVNYGHKKVYDICPRLQQCFKDIIAAKSWFWMKRGPEIFFFS